MSRGTARVAARTAAAAACLAIALGSPVLADVFRILDGDQEAAQARIDLVRQARLSLDAEYFIVEDDQVSMVGLALLRDAARRGVVVRLIVDGSFNRMSKAIQAYLVDQGVEIRSIPLPPHEAPLVDAAVARQAPGRGRRADPHGGAPTSPTRTSASAEGLRRQGRAGRWKSRGGTPRVLPRSLVQRRGEAHALGAHDPSVREARREDLPRGDERWRCSVFRDAAIEAYDLAGRRMDEAMAMLEMASWFGSGERSTGRKGS